MARGTAEGNGHTKIAIRFENAQFQYIDAFAKEKGISFSKAVTKLVHVGYKYKEQA